MSANLPPGCTQAEIDRIFGGDDDSVECWKCGGVGLTPGCFEDCCSGADCDPEDAELCCSPSRCDVCKGKGGWLANED